MPTLCPECGAPQIDGDSCRDRYDRCLVLEFADRRFGIVHNLTVPSYNLQHPSILSAGGWLATRALLGRFVNEGVIPQQIRAESRRQFAGKDWSISRGPSLELPEEFAWRQTIPVVHDTDPERYVAAISAWARSVLEDAAAISAAGPTSP